MISQPSRHLIFACLISMTLALISTACSLTPPVPADAELKLRFAEAVADARVATPDEISKNLIAITEESPDVRWDSSHQKLLVVTWTGWEGYDAEVGNAMTLPREVWVTVVPQLMDFCRTHKLTPASADLRLEQLLGLPPHSGKTRFVEIWVSPTDLFRPSADPEISDHEAEIEFPSSEDVLISQRHLNWFKNRKAYSYGPDGYPWTRLGYTYDWGNPDSEVGLSEFVIRAGATVRVHSVTETCSYCQ